MGASVVQSCNALNNDKDKAELQKLLSSMQKDIAALSAAVNAITAQLDTNVVAGHPYSVAANNPAMGTTA